MEKHIPITDAENIGKTRDYSQIIITGWDDVNGVTTVTTWGKDATQCEQAAKGGNYIKKALGWPNELTEVKPVCKHKKNDISVLENENTEMRKLLQKFVDVIKEPSIYEEENISEFVYLAVCAKKFLSIKQINTNENFN